MQNTVVRQTGEDKADIGIAGVGTTQATVVHTMPVWKMVMVRVARVYFQAFSGFLGAQMLGIDDLIGVPLQQFGNQYYIAAIAALGSSIPTLVMNATEVLTRLDVTHPRMRA